MTRRLEDALADLMRNPGAKLRWGTIASVDPLIVRLGGTTLKRLATLGTMPPVDDPVLVLFDGRIGVALGIDVYQTPENDPGVGQAGGSTGTPKWEYEQLPITSAFAGSWQLMHYPLEKSEVLRLNGVTLTEHIDYSVADGIVTFTNPTDLLLGIGASTWSLDVTYPYLFDLIGPDGGTPSPEVPVLDYSALVLAASPVAYYRLGEASGTTMIDSSGNGHNGTYVVPPTLGTMGLVTSDPDTAATFNGSSQYGSTSSVVQVSTTGMTITAIIKLSATPGASSGMIVGLDDYPGIRVAQFRVESTLKMVAKVWLGGSLFSYTSTTTLSIGTKYVVALRYNGTTVDFFLNGVLDGSTAATGNLDGAGTQVDVGAVNAGSVAGYFPGVLDEIAIFSTALSDADITTLALAAS